MVKVAGYWDIWYQSKENEYDISWRFMLRHFKIDEMYLMPHYNISNNMPLQLDHTEVKLTELDNIEDVIKLNGDLTPVMIDERGRTPLQEFIHPDNVLYIFGRTGFSPWTENWVGESVFVESHASQLGNALLHPNQACSIVLYDRMVKQWLS